MVRVRRVRSGVHHRRGEGAAHPVGAKVGAENKGAGAPDPTRDLTPAPDQRQHAEQHAGDTGEGGHRHWGGQEAEAEAFDQGGGGGRDPAGDAVGGWGKRWVGVGGFRGVGGLAEELGADLIGRAHV